MTQSRTLTIAVFVVLLTALSAAAVEAILRTNPITNPPAPIESVGVSSDAASLEPSPHGEWVAGPNDLLCILPLAENLVVGGRDSGISVLSVDATGNISVVGQCDVAGEPVGMASAGDIVYVAAAWAGVQVIDCSDATAPRVINSLPLGGPARAVSVSDELAFVAIWDRGMSVLDISEPATPTVVSSIDTPGHAYSVAVGGTTAYIADFESGVQLIDIADPSRPAIVGEYYAPIASTDVRVVGSTAFIADEQKGLLAVDISDPLAPVILYEHAGAPARALASGSTAMVLTDLNGGVTLFEPGDDYRAIKYLKGRQPALDAEIADDTVFFVSGVLCYAPLPRDVE